MVRKRLGDLVRQEAQDRSEDEADNATALEVEATVVPEASEEADDESVASGAKRSNPTKADLETTVKELKAALQAAESDNNSWQEKNSALQSDLQHQKILVDKLLIELEEAKQTILKLTESNSPPPKLENNYPPTKLENNYPPTKLENNSPPPKIESKSTKSTNLALRKLPYHSMKPNSSSADISDSNSDSISNSDLGWFD